MFGALSATNNYAMAAQAVGANLLISANRSKRIVRSSERRCASSIEQSTTSIMESLILAQDER
ncbi:hypothetical protein, partial [Planomicrobium okeanokoites]|uniref:hypothetical protein n=1 Tax=Planomicrobium okeanokoites TaxID=244 RepID=UPI00197B83DA